MLFNTNYDNASLFAEDIQKTVTIKNSKTQFKIHTYPNSKKLTNEINEINSDSIETIRVSAIEPIKNKDL